MCGAFKSRFVRVKCVSGLSVWIVFTLRVAGLSVFSRLRRRIKYDFFAPAARVRFKCVAGLSVWFEVLKIPQCPV